MTPEDEKRFRLIIREEIWAAIQNTPLAVPSTPLCKEPDFTQTLNRMLREREARQARKLAKKSNI